ncbi:hypothetical protein [Endozoicomonas sp. ONNA1]|uniref:hypothetical protein n=1 Tax=Endozoicomonas sp. ONNA1 TaxID=2828740 RepID=UPI002149006A|nr:hypothetical protein [Endozoicomonas sp. ONNA1]
MKLVHALFLMFPYWGFGDSEVAVFVPNQKCSCYPAGFPGLNVDINFESAIQKNILEWYNCSYNYETEASNCSGMIANDSSCYVSYSGKISYSGKNSETEDHFLSINCNDNSCVTSITSHGWSPYVCQTPKGCFSLVNDGTCVLPKTFKNENDIKLYYDFHDCEIDWLYCSSGQGEAFLYNSKKNVTATIYDDSCGTPYYGCPFGCSSDQIKNCQPFDFIRDGSCDVKYFVCDNINFLACKNGEAIGNCTNPRSNEICRISNQDNSNGNLNCPSCGVGWSLSSIGYPVRDNIFSQFYVESCIEPVKDGSCHLPDSFKCKGVLWDVCVNGIGQGKCTNDMESCDIIMSSDCPVTKSKTCGAIKCDGCEAGWNLPDQPALYDFPLGCMNKPSPFSPGNEKLIIPLSVAGGVVFVGIVAAIVGVSVYFCKYRYRRQGYQHIDGLVTN